MLEKSCAKCKVLMQTEGNFLKLKTRYHSWCNVCRKKEKQEWDNKNKDYTLQVAKEWHYKNYSKHKERIFAYQKEWKKNNLEKYKIYAKKCYHNNKEKVYANCAKYRAKKRNAAPAWLNDEMQIEIEGLFKKAKEMFNVTGVKYEVDHIIPLQGVNVCGLHVPWNLQILTRFENRSKKNLIKE